MWRVRAWRCPEAAEAIGKGPGKGPGTPGRGAMVALGAERPAGLTRARVRHGTQGGKKRSAQPREGINPGRSRTGRHVSTKWPPTSRRISHERLRSRKFTHSSCSQARAALVRVPWNVAPPASVRRERARSEETRSEETRGEEAGTARCPRSVIPVSTAVMNSAPQSGAPCDARIHTVPFHPHHRRSAPSCSPKAKNSTAMVPSPHSAKHAAARRALAFDHGQRFAGTTVGAHIR